MLIFLDIDGVMVPAKGWKSPELLEDGFPDFSAKASRVLQHLISENTTILLTTSHKSNHSLEEWRNIFSRRGIEVENIKSLDNNLDKISRKDEILNWFKVNKPIEDFLILDDDKSLSDLPDFLKENLVLTSPYIGLTDDHLGAIEAILNKEVRFT